MPNIKSLLLFIGSIIFLLISDLFQTSIHWYLKEFSPPELSYFFEKVVLSEVWLLSLLSLIVLICFLISLFILLAVLNLFKLDVDINAGLVGLSKVIIQVSGTVVIMSYIQTINLEKFPFFVVVVLMLLLILSLRGKKAVSSKRKPTAYILSLIVLALVYVALTSLVSSPVRNLLIVKSFNQRDAEKKLMRISKQKEVRDLIQEYGIDKRWDQEMIRTTNSNLNYIEKMAEKTSKMGSILFVARAHCKETGDVFSACYDWRSVGSYFLEAAYLDCVEFQKEGEGLVDLNVGERFATIVKVHDVVVLKDQSIHSKYRAYVPIKITGACGPYVRLGDSYLEGKSYRPLKTMRTPWAGSGVVYRPEEASLADVLLFRTFLDG